MIHDSLGKIEVVGYHDGKEVCRYNVETTGEAAAIKLTVDKTSVDADGRSVVQAEVRILDSEGHLVFDACPELNFKLEGDGEIIGIDNGVQRAMSSGRKLRDVMHLMEWLMWLFVQDKTREN